MRCLITLLNGKSRLGKCLIALLLISCWATPAFAEEGATSSVNQTPIVIGWAIALLCSLVALGFAFKFFKWMVAQNEGDETMVRIAEHVRSGANAYLYSQYKVVGIFFVIACILLAIVAFVFDAQ